MIGVVLLGEASHGASEFLQPSGEDLAPFLVVDGGRRPELPVSP